MASSTQVQINALVTRVALLEDVVNDLQTAVMNLATQEQIRQIVLIKQAEWDTANTQITALQNQIALLEAEVYN